jgi:hypothetical protein
MICFEDKEIRHPQSTCFSSCLCFFMGPAWKLTWQSPAQVKQQDLYISPARNQFYIVIKPDLGLIWLMNQVPSYIQGYIVIKERFLARRKNTFEKKIGLYRVDPASQPRLIVFLLLLVFHLTWTGPTTGSVWV